jgi:uncharacterized protein YutE (UPF0331/DUF86 family)
VFLKGEKGKIKNTLLASRCANLLGNNEVEKEAIQKTLKRAYKIRNCIIHSSEYQRFETDPSEQTGSDILPELVSKVEQYLRKSIVWSLQKLSIPITEPKER